MLDELKDNKSADRLPHNNNFTFNKEEMVMEAESKLSEEDLQNMRSLKSELSNSRRIEVIEEEQSEIVSEKRHNTKPASEKEHETKLEPRQAEQQQQEEQPNDPHEELEELHTSNDNKFGGKTRKTKGGDESSKDQILVNRPINNVPHTDDSRLDGHVGMKDVLSEPEPNKARLKFKGKNEQASPEIEER